ncbi:MAG: hypothetical protein JOZ80_07250 [Acidobacteriaceae bacterium]|nr:hypothetical protein [Acidobacteriaceae bacterium]
MLKKRLAESDQLINVAEHCGVLQGLSSTLRRLLRIRDAWSNVLDCENVSGCFCADDTNPSTRIALLLAKGRGLPTVACHHGALDCWMALKDVSADLYLAKSEMERDYLINMCGVSRYKVALGGPVASNVIHRTGANEKSWMVFFTEAYEASGWRSDELYGDLLPRLQLLAERCSLKLVLKLHPFDSIRDHRRKLKRILKSEARNIEIIAGSATADLWRNTKFALTCESSTVLECAAQAIPVFLCTWLRDCYSGYSEQYAKFGAGVPLQSPEQIADIPELLTTRQASYAPVEEGIKPETFRGLFNPPIKDQLMRNEPAVAACAT